MRLPRSALSTIIFSATLSVFSPASSLLRHTCRNRRLDLVLVTKIKKVTIR